MNIHANRLDGGPFIHLARWLKHTVGGEIKTELGPGKWILNYGSFLAYRHTSKLQNLDYIVYNTEILEHKFRTTPAYRQFLAGASEVWDYSESNLQHWGGIYKPFGAYPCEKVEPKAKKWDVCFYGLMSPRRDKILKELTESGLSVVHVGLDNYNNVKNAKFGAALKEPALDDYIAKSRIVLSMHYLDEPHLNDSLRIVPALMKGAFVIAEPAGDGWVFGHHNLFVWKDVVNGCHQVIHELKFAEKHDIHLRS